MQKKKKGGGINLLNEWIKKKIEITIRVEMTFNLLKKNFPLVFMNIIDCSEFLVDISLC